MKKIWNWLNGKKTLIGLGIILMAKAGKAFAPDLLSPDQYDFIETAGEYVSLIGGAHKVAKSKTVNDAISRAQNAMNRRKANK